uniref:Candidate secreted effector n=1 Tax=Meloidogyne incognita TaxID=6306 RepID=A0A914LDF0_MELIC
MALQKSSMVTSDCHRTNTIGYTAADCSTNSAASTNSHQCLSTSSVHWMQPPKRTYNQLPATEESPPKRPMDKVWENNQK